jgi:hypothetical protein
MKERKMGKCGIWRLERKREKWLSMERRVRKRGE